jgi:hypothetical protein
LIERRRTLASGFGSALKSPASIRFQSRIQKRKATTRDLQSLIIAELLTEPFAIFRELAPPVLGYVEENVGGLW